MFKPYKKSGICNVLFCVGFVLSLAVYCYAQTNEIFTLRELQSDNACGPRALWALMQITRSGQPKCDIGCIYELAGKEPLKPTSMKDLRDIAQKLGFSASGHRLTVADLGELDGYAILPVGTKPGTRENPLHFILVKNIIKDLVIFVNANTLQFQALDISELKRFWNGYALVISAGQDMPPLPKPVDNMEKLYAKRKLRSYDDVKDFGLVDSGSRLEHTFTIPDKTDKAKIVSKSCSCLTAKLGKNTKGQNTLALELHVDKPAWKEAHAAVLLEPEGIIKKYALRAYGKDSFRITPVIGYIEAPHGGVIEYPVKIDYFSGSDDVIKYDHMKSDIPNLKVISVKETSITKGDATTFSFEIPLIFDAGENPPETKNIGGTVSFVLNTGDGDRIIPLKLSARVGIDKYKLNPEKVFMMVSKSTGSKPRKAKIEFLMSACPANITISPDDNLPVKINATQITEASYMMEIDVSQEKLKDLAPGLHKSKITIIPKGLPDLGPITLPAYLSMTSK